MHKMRVNSYYYLFEQFIHTQEITYRFQFEMEHVL